MSLKVLKGFQSFLCVFDTKQFYKDILSFTFLGIFSEKRSITFIDFEKSTNKESIESAEVPERTPMYKLDFGIKF